MISDFGDLATWTSVALTMITGVVAVFVFIRLRLRDRRQALTDLHISLTSGETAAARNTVGTLLYATRRQDHPSRLDSIAAYFALIYAVQRARNVFHTYSVPWTPLGTPQSRLRELATGRPARDSRLALSWNLAEIGQNLVRFHDEYGSRWGVEDTDAWDELKDYADADGLRREVRAEHNRLNR